MQKVYHPGEFIGQGSEATFFRLRGYKHLGVKVVHNLMLVKNPATFLKKELESGQLLRRLGFPVPRHIKMVLVKPEPSANMPRENQLMFLNHWEERWGIVVEFIEHDVRMVAPRDIARLYEAEKKRFAFCGIQVRASSPNQNVLYSAKHNKLYFIDFGDWRIPSEQYIKQKLKERERQSRLHSF